MAMLVEGFAVVELPYVLVFDTVRLRVRCPYCLLEVPCLFVQGGIQRCASCRVYWIRWMESLYGAVRYGLGVRAFGLREIEDVYAWRYAELGRAA